MPLCGFHHLTAIHRWGWDLRLNPDGTTTATSPDRTRTLHSHGPPGHSPDGSRALPTMTCLATRPNGTTSALPAWWASLPA